MHAEAQAAARQRLQQQQQQQRRIQPVQARGVLAEMAEFMRLADADEVRSRVSVDAQQRLSTWLPINGPVEQSRVCSLDAYTGRVASVNLCVFPGLCA